MSQKNEILSEPNSYYSNDCFADEDGVPFMPFFEVENSEDRPFAPDAEDFPIGCQVRLKDIESARLAQTDAHWEPFFDTIFSKPDRTVTVLRHQGDYTFVVCNDEEGFEMIGLTLYRACLDEPNVALRPGQSFCEDVDSSNVAPLPRPSDAKVRREVERRYCEETSSVHGSSAENQLSPSPSNVSASSDSKPLSSSEPHSRFAIAMKYGILEIEKKKYKKAIQCFNLALEEAPEEEPRVLRNRSVAYWYLQENELALQDAFRAIELMPNNHVGYVRAGNIYRGMKQFEKARTLYLQAKEKAPSNTQLKSLLADNCIAMLYDLRTRRYPQLKVTHHMSYGRAVLMTTHSVAEKTVLAKENTSLSGGIPSKSSSSCCEHCRFFFMNRDEVCQSVPGLDSTLLGKLSSPTEAVKCDHCKALYCSKSCKTHAWSEHHWIECRGRGQWRRGLRELDSFFDAYVEGANEIESVNLLEDVNPPVVAACCKVAVRMMSRMSSCVWKLEEAAEIYNWLDVSGIVVAQREKVKNVLQFCFNLLWKGFSDECKEVLTFNIFQSCYERVKSTALILTVSPWPKIRKRAQELLANSKENITIDSSLSYSEKEEAILQSLLNDPRKHVPGTYHRVLCVFELQALTNFHLLSSAFLNRARKPTVSWMNHLLPNVEVVPVESNEASIHFRVTQSLKKRALIISADQV